MNNAGSLTIPMEMTGDIMNTQFYDKVDDYKTLEQIKKNCRLETYEERVTDHYKVFFDFETITTGKAHEPYLCWIYNNDVQREIIGIKTCAVDMLNALPTDKKEFLIAHNYDYDCKFLLEYLQNVKPIVKSNLFLQIKETYFNPVHKKRIKIIVKDSYKLIPMPLREFGKCFNVDCHKEVMPYRAYTYGNVDMGACSIQSALDILKDGDKQQQLLDNIEKWECTLGKDMDNQMFDLIKYSSIYCKMDCKVLMDGYEVFIRWMLAHTELDVYNFITIQSKASPFMLKPGCYGNVYQISCVLQQFISRCVVGGRVMANSNKRYHVKKKIAGFDASALYPSAMHFMDGFLEDKPKVINDIFYEFLKQQDGYYIRIIIIKLNKHLDFLLTSNINENCVRDFINDMENDIIYIDKVGLKELITYHEAEFEIIDGCYYDQIINNIINHVIEDLYNLRFKLKKRQKSSTDCY